MDVCKRRRRDSSGTGIAGIQKVLIESIGSLATYRALLLCQHYYTEFLSVIESIGKGSCSPESVAAANYALDLAALYILAKRNEAVHDAQKIVRSIARLFQPELPANDSMVPPQYRPLCPPLARHEDSDDEVESFGDATSRVLVQWLSLRLLRLTQDNDTFPPYTFAHLVTTAKSKPAVCSVFRKDGIVAAKGILSRKTEPFHLDWKGPADLAGPMREADEESIKHFFRSSYKYSMLASVSKPENGGSLVCLFTDLLKSSNNHWLETLPSALLRKKLKDPVTDTLESSLPGPLKDISFLLSAPGRESADGECSLLQLAKDHPCFVQTTEELLQSAGDSMTTEERAFWGLHCGKFSDSVLLAENWEEVLMCWVTAWLVQASAAASAGRGATGKEPVYEIARKAAPSLQKRLNDSRRSGELAVTEVVRTLEECCESSSEELDEIRLLLSIIPFFRDELEASTFTNALNELITTISGVRSSLEPYAVLSLCEVAALIMRTEWSSNEAKREGGGAGENWYSDDSGCVTSANQLSLLTISNLVMVRESQLENAPCSAFVARVLELADENTQSECLGIFLTSELKVCALDETCISDLFNLTTLIHQEADPVTSFQLLFSACSIALKNLQIKLIGKIETLKKFAECSDENSGTSSLPVHEDFVELANEMSLLQRFLAHMARLYPDSLVEMLSLAATLGNGQQFLDAYYFQRLRNDSMIGGADTAVQQTPALWGISSRYSEDPLPADEEAVSPPVVESSPLASVLDSSAVVWTYIDDHTTAGRAIRLRSSSQPKMQSPPESVWVSETFHQIVVPLIEGYSEQNHAMPLSPIWRKRECKLNPILADDESRGEVDEWHTMINRSEESSSTQLALAQYFSLLYRPIIMSAIASLGVELCRSQSESGLIRCEKWLKRIGNWVHEFMGPRFVDDEGFPGVPPDAETATIRSLAWQCFHTDVNSAVFKFGRILVVGQTNTLSLCVSLADLFGALFNPSS